MERIAFLFPGQGSQYVGMSKTFYEQYDVVKHTFEEANDILGFNLSELCFKGSLGKLSQIENSLVALLTSSVAAFRVYMQEIGVAPQYCVGHSLGEYSALTCSGVMSFADAVKIVYKRGQIAKEVADTGIGAMTIVDGISGKIVEDECKNISDINHQAAISCYNSSSEVAISGHLDAVQKVEDKLFEKNAQITPLIGNAPFHNSLMVDASIKLRDELVKYSYNNFRWPVISNVTGMPYENSEDIVDMLTNQIIKPVKWQGAMNYLKNRGITLTVEMGAKNVLSNLIKEEVHSIKALSFDQMADRKELQQILTKNSLYKKHVPTVITKCLSIGAATPNNNEDTEQYRTGVIEPYKKLQEIQYSLEKDDLEPSIEQMKQALELLSSILTTKNISRDEQIKWFNNIIDETGTNYLFKDLELRKQ